jgi:hypothetical protein
MLGEKELFTVCLDTRNLPVETDSIRLHHSRQGDNIDMACARFSKGFSAFIDGGTGRENIVDEENLFIAQGPGLRDDKRLSEIFEPIVSS